MSTEQITNDEINGHDSADLIAVAPASGDQQPELQAADPDARQIANLAAVAQMADDFAKKVKETRAQAFMAIILTADGQLATMETHPRGSVAPFDDIDALLDSKCTPADSAAPTEH
jgi:hypothetical protein